MLTIEIHSNHKLAKAILNDALQAEKNRISYALQLGQKRLELFEKKYGVSSEIFLSEWTAEKLEGKDIEYIEWAGEAKLYSRMRERLITIKEIKYDDQ